MPGNLPGSVAVRLAAAALMLLVAWSLGCGKNETSRETAAKPTAKSSGDRGIALPDGFPRDVPILKNATLKAAVSQGDRMVVQLYTISSIREAMDFYNAELKKEGWTVESASGTGDIAIAAKKGHTLCSVTIARDGKGTLIRLAISPARS